MGIFSFLSKKNKEENQEKENVVDTVKNAEVSTGSQTEQNKDPSKEQKSDSIKEQSEELKKDLKTYSQQEQNTVSKKVQNTLPQENNSVDKKASNVETEHTRIVIKDPKKAAEIKDSQSTGHSKEPKVDNEIAKELSNNSEIKESKEVVTKIQIAVPKKEEKLVTEKTSETGKNEQDNSVNQNKTEEIKVKKSFFERLKRTRENLALGIGALVSGKKIDEDLYEELETALLTADLGVDTTDTIIEKLREESKLRELKDASALKNNLKNILKDILKPCAVPLEIKKNNGLPFVILMVGVNGAGKTTTIGKLALKYKEQGMSVMLAAGDTFRAAAVEQLKEWGNRTNTPVVSQPTGSDSASVIYDALTSAKAHNTDVLICDTAGRLQNKDNLMEELKKIVRVMKKIDENVPNEVMLVLDSTTGQNAVSQMKIFGEAVNVSGLVLTKLDGTAKGGVVFALADKFKVPLRYVGIGESKEDLRVFDVDHFVDALFD